VSAVAEKVRKKPPSSLFRQIVVPLALATLVFALLNLAMVIVTYSVQPDLLAEELLSYEAKLIAGSSSQELESFPAPAGATHWSVRYLPADSSAIAPITDTNESEPAGVLMDWTRRERLDRGVRVTGVRSIGEGANHRWVFMRFENEGLRPYVPVIISEIVQHAVLPLVPLVAMLLLFNIAAVRRVLAPLRSAEHEIDRLDPKAMSERLSETDGPREVNALIRAVNRALGRLEESMGILRDFTANAAHELRTPLAIMHLSLQRLPDDPLRRELQGDMDDMSKLISQLLDLAQAEALALEKLTIIDLSEVGRDVVAALAPKAFSENRELRFEDKGGALARGHREAVSRIYRNLIDNALAHSGDGGPIEITAGPGAMISVRDHGRGIAEEDKHRLFDRFWRKHQHSGDGIGLGLGIVQRLVHALHGQIDVDNAPDGGACFVVRFLDDTLETPSTTNPPSELSK